jgi:hypothetical protein
MDLSDANVLRTRVMETARRAAEAAGTRAPAASNPLRERHLRETAATVCAQLAVGGGHLLATYAAVAVFELHLHPERLVTHVAVHLVARCGARWRSR